MSAAPAMSVAIVNHNTREHLRSCLASVRAEGVRETVVADTGSTDGSAEMVREEFPEVRLLADLGNPGYGAASNAAFRACSAPFVLLLNADTQLRPGAAGALAAHFDRHPRAAVVGPRLVYPNGRLQVSCFPFLGTFQLLLEQAPPGRWLARIPAVRDRWLVSLSLHDRPRVVPWVLGAAMAFRREAFDAAGGFDPSFFMFSEEVDLCRRLEGLGWEVHFTPDATVVHSGGASTRQRRPQMALCMLVSSKRFFRRHYPPWRASVLEGVMDVGLSFRVLRDTFRLAVTREPAARSRLLENLSVWRDALRSHPS